MQFFRIKNYEQYQGKKSDRNSLPWIKLHKKLMNDYAYGELLVSEKLMFIHMLLIADSIANEFPVNAKWMRTKLQVHAKWNFASFESKGLIEIIGEREKPENATRREEKRKEEKRIKPLVGEGKEKEKEILDYLNQKAGRRTGYKPTEANLKFISGRLAEGYSLEDFKRVIDCKVKQWRGDQKMDKFLRPATLFNPTNFPGYANEMAPATPRGEEPYIPPQEPKPRTPGDPVLEEFWNKTLKKLKPKVETESYSAWFEPTYPRSLSNGTLQISVPNQFVRKNLIDNYRGLIESTLSDIRGSPILADFSVDR